MQVIGRVSRSWKHHFFLKSHAQVHLVIPDRYAGFILGKNGSRIQKTASKSGCKACVLCCFFFGGFWALG